MMVLKLFYIIYLLVFKKALSSTKTNEKALKVINKTENIKPS